jgi:hypothetical protein
VAADVAGAARDQDCDHPMSRKWCRVRDLNPRPSVYKTAALPLC